MSIVRKIMKSSLAALLWMAARPRCTFGSLHLPEDRHEHGVNDKPGS